MKTTFKALLLLAASFSLSFGMEESEPLQPKKIVISSMDALKELEKNPQETTNLHLNFEGNKIGDQGVVALRDGIKELHRLTNLYLNLEWNQIGKEGEEFIKNTLINLIMEGNLLDYVGVGRYLQDQKYIQKALGNKRRMIAIRQALNKQNITRKYRKEVTNEALNYFILD